MTKETLQEANKLNHAINDLEAQIKIAEEMRSHVDNRLVLEAEYIGTIAIISTELRDDIIELVLRHLSKAKDDMEDKLRLL